MPISSLTEPGALEDVQVLVLTPTWALLSTEEHDALLVSLREMTKDMGLIVMELISLSEERRAEEGAQGERPSHKKVLWPCGIDELEQRIEAALRTAAR
jgi:cobalamin biosynthesis Mg chelatase CobN